jgi:hypothetical protein
MTSDGRSRPTNASSSAGSMPGVTISPSTSRIVVAKPRISSSVAMPGPGPISTPCE